MKIINSRTSCREEKLTFFFFMYCLNYNVSTVPPAFSIAAFATTAAANIINQIIERNLDKLMTRTENRPLPSGRLSVKEAAVFGWIMAAVAMYILFYEFNYKAGLLALLSMILYGFVYTPLKRVGPVAVAVGALPGAFPPMIGWVAATGSVSVEAFLMFMLIFMWTPPHFWALALFMKSDYGDAKVPMLTETHGRKSTRAHVWWYTVLLVPFSMALAFTSIGGPVYMLAAVILNLMFLRGAWSIWRRDEAVAEGDRYRVEKSVFRFSLLYLFLLFVALLADAALRAMGV